MRLPRQVRLPFGYTVQVKEVSDSEMRAEDEDGGLNDGLWDAETKTIYVRASIPPRRKRYILVHEMGHALWDYQHELFDEGAARP